MMDIFLSNVKLCYFVILTGRGGADIKCVQLLQKCALDGERATGRSDFLSVAFGKSALL